MEEKIKLEDLDFTSREVRKRFISKYTGLYSGYNVDGEMVVVESTKDVGMLVKTIHKEKPKWFEVVEYDKDGFQQSVSYDPA